MQTVEGMKLVCHELGQDGNDAEITTMDDLVRDLESSCDVIVSKGKFNVWFICV